jgi:hypothetical protein
MIPMEKLAGSYWHNPFDWILDVELGMQTTPCEVRQSRERGRFCREDAPAEQVSKVDDTSHLANSS